MSTDLSLSRALHYGHGCFTTLVYRDRQPLLWAYHWQRLQQGCAVLGLLCEEKNLQQQLQQTINAQTENVGIIKIMLLADNEATGYSSTSINTQIILVPRSLPQQGLQEKRHKGCDLMRCEYRLAQQPKLAGIKHLNRLDQILASQELLNLNCDDGIMLNMDDQVIETTCANLFWRIGSQWFTPDLSLSGVSGVVRALIIQWFDDHQEPIHIQPLHWTQFCQADEVLLCNAVRGIWPVVRIDQKTLAIGSFTRHLQTQLALCFS